MKVAVKQSPAPSVSTTSRTGIASTTSHGRPLYLYRTPFGPIVWMNTLSGNNSVKETSGTFSSENLMTSLTPMDSRSALVATLDGSKYTSWQPFRFISLAR